MIILLFSTFTFKSTSFTSQPHILITFFLSHAFSQTLNLHSLSSLYTHVYINSLFCLYMLHLYLSLSPSPFLPLSISIYPSIPIDYICILKMNGYSKINPNDNTHKSRSIDFSDFFFFPQTPKPIRNASKMTRTEELNQIENDQAQKSSPERAEEDNDGEAVGEHRHGERFGVVLGRSASVSSSAIGLQGTMKRALSIRRSSSVSERYCRIHDQYVALASPIGEDGEGESNGGKRSVMKKKQRGGGGKILRACKRLLGF